MNSRQKVMIVDTDRNRTKSLRRILREAQGDLAIEEVSQVEGAQEAILGGRPTLVLLHTTFPYLHEDGTGLVELLREDFRNRRIGLMLVLPISGSLLYRSGYQEGMEMLDLADDVITTDFTSDMIQSVVAGYLERRTVAAEAFEPEAAAEPEYAFLSK